ncbi:MAG TPA: hypothetical protein VE954_43550 [Oligoflexus sp.]|uniref:hypothetical protein n=1 Tax=Oligoflexus sp. TaxID=1971216 RepID=UPI002D4107DC|nr:hypothetical protein [Oligoflexus sp.]HYX40021.1 hypothetical protein [Oligoflexus sp.]
MEKDKIQSVAPTVQSSDEFSLPQSARLLRMIEKLGLKPDTIEGLRRSILVDDTQAKDSRPGAHGKPAPQFATDEVTGTISVPIAVQPEPRPTRGAVLADHTHSTQPLPTMENAKAATTRLDHALEAELKLRHKVEAEQNWAAFRQEAWQLFEAFPRPEMAARIVDLALLYGSVSDLEEVLGSFLKHDVQFYTLIDGDLRSHLVVKLWQAERWAILDGLMFRKDLQLRLLPIERLYACWSFIRAGEAEKAFKFFRRYDREIWAAQKEFGALLKRSESELALVLGRQALADGDEALAIRLLESISRQVPEFQKALDLLLDIRIERDDSGLCPYGQKLQRELDWRARVDLLDSFLLRMQRFEAASPKDRAALNELLKDPLRWVPEQPEAWQAMSEVLLQYHQLEYLLPQINTMFLQKAVQFHKPAFDHAIWAPVRAFHFPDSIKTWFWHAVAMLHEFVWSQGQQENLLWDARKSYREAADHSGKALPLTWVHLHRHLLQWVSKTERLQEPARVKLLLMVRLVGEGKDIDEQDVCNFLVQVAQPSREVIKALENLAREREQSGLELFILDRKALGLHYVNQDLGRVWQLGANLKRYDLCWRVATVLKHRTVLNEQLERHWQICGERRRDFSILDLTEAHVRKVVHSFDGHERKLVEGILTVGPLIPELLASLHPQLTPVKKPKVLSEVEDDIHNALEKISWMPKPKKIYSPNPSGLWQPKPPFFASLLDSKWSLLFVALAQRLGITAWDWQLSLLHHQIESIIPRMMRGAETPAQGKVGRWLRSLTPAQRKAWYELAQQSRRFDDEEAQGIISRFLTRLTTTLLQDHSLALQGLEKMRAPLRLRWDLEHWIVSDVYGELRRSLGHFTIGQFPEEVYLTPVLAPAKAQT